MSEKFLSGTKNSKQTNKQNTQRCFMPSLVENGLVILEKNLVNVYLLLHYYLLLEKGRALHLNKLEYALCQVWLKLTKWVRRRSFFLYL